MVRLRANGLTHRAIAEQLGISRRTVSNYLERATPHQPRRAARRFTAAERQFILDHARQGWSATAIGEAIGRHASAVADIIRQAGLTYVHRHVGRGGRLPRLVVDGHRALGVDDDTRRAIVSAARRTGTLAGTARATGVSVEVAERVLERHAPLVLHAYVRGNVLSPGFAIDRTAGTLATMLHGYWSRDTLDTLAGYDELVEDFGADTVRGWLERFERDRQAVRDLMRELRHALARAEAM